MRFEARRCNDHEMMRRQGDVEYQVTEDVSPWFGRSHHAQRIGPATECNGAEIHRWHDLQNRVISLAVDLGREQKDVIAVMKCSQDKLVIQGAKGNKFPVHIHLSVHDDRLKCRRLNITSLRYQTFYGIEYLGEFFPPAE